MTVAELPDDINDYYKAKAKDLPKSVCTDLGDLMDALDKAVINAMDHAGSYAKVEEAIEAVLNHPGSTWSREVLNYRLRQVHYK
jgi:hypothetical protein